MGFERKSATESLGLMALPMKINTNRHITDLKRTGAGISWGECAMRITFARVGKCHIA